MFVGNDSTHRKPAEVS